MTLLADQPAADTKAPAAAGVGRTTKPTAAATPKPLLPHQISVEMYHRLMAEGVIGHSSYLELIDGVIVRNNKGSAPDAMSKNPPHAFVMKRLAALCGRFDGTGGHLMLESPIVLSDRTEPEPDAAVIVGPDVNYLDANPTADQVLAVVEVADASLVTDLGTKRDRYAAAGIGTYLVLRLPTRDAVLFSDPADGVYNERRTLAADATVTLPTGDGSGVEVALADVLPPADD